VISDQDYKKADKNVLLVLPTDDKAFSEEAKNELIRYAYHQRGHMNVKFLCVVFVNPLKEILHIFSVLLRLIAKIKPISDQDYKKADKNVLLVLPTDDKAFSEEAAPKYITRISN